MKPAFPDVTPHVLRHSFASTANDLGHTEASIAAMLGHAAGATTSRYVRSVDSVLVAATDKVCQHVAGLLGGGAVQLDALAKLLNRWDQQPTAFAAE